MNLSSNKSLTSYTLFKQFILTVWRFLITPSLVALVIFILTGTSLISAGSGFNYTGNAPWAVEISGVSRLIHRDAFDCKTEMASGESFYIFICDIDINGNILQITAPSYSDQAPCDAFFAQEPISCQRIRLTDGLRYQGIQLSSSELLAKINSGWSVPFSWKTIFIRVPEHVLLRYFALFSALVATFCAFFIPKLLSWRSKPHYPSHTFTTIYIGIGALFFMGMSIWLFLNGFIQPFAFWEAPSLIASMDMGDSFRMASIIIFTPLGLGAIFYLSSVFKRHRPLFSLAPVSKVKVIELKAITSLVIFIALYHEIAFSLLQNGFID